jgi:ERCC4-related helicase
MRNSFPEVLHKIIGLGRRVEGNPDIKEIIMKIEEEFRKFGEESRFLIFVKTRSTAFQLLNIRMKEIDCLNLPDH